MGTATASERAEKTYQNAYTYDRMNRLVAAVQDGQEEKYAYDPSVLLIK